MRAMRCGGPLLQVVCSTSAGRRADLVLGCHAHRRTSEIGCVAAVRGEPGVVSPRPKRPDFGSFFDTKRDDFF
jgi:hypothetical protein